MGRSYTSRNSNSKAVHIHHEVTKCTLKYYVLCDKLTNINYFSIFIIS